jgi:hypothetical protein
MQCEPIVPSADAEGDPEFGASMEDDLLKAIDFFTAQRIEIVRMGFLWFVDGRGTCAACGCPALVSLVVQAADGDSDRLVDDFEFQRVEPRRLAGLQPLQCSLNPWDEDPPPADRMLEGLRVAVWAGESGAPLVGVGFADPVDPMAFCSECACPRGDVIIAWPQDWPLAASLGFTDLTAPNGPSLSQAGFRRPEVFGASPEPKGASRRRPTSRAASTAP